MLITFPADQKDLEPTMDATAIKKYIKDSLLSHDVMAQAREHLHYNDKQSKIVSNKTRYWQAVTPEYLDKFIDEMYGNPLTDLEEERLPMVKLKKSFTEKRAKNFPKK